MRRRSSVLRMAEGRVVLTLVGHDVGEGEVCVALQADVDEGGVHAGQDVLDDPLEDGADDALLALDAVLGELAVLEEGDAGLSVGDVHDDLLRERLRTALAVLGGRRRRAGRTAVTAAAGELGAAHVQMARCWFCEPDGEPVRYAVGKGRFHAPPGSPEVYQLFGLCVKHRPLEVDGVKRTGRIVNEYVKVVSATFERHTDLIEARLYYGFWYPTWHIGVVLKQADTLVPGRKTERMLREEVLKRRRRNKSFNPGGSPRSDKLFVVTVTFKLCAWGKLDT